MLKLKERKMLKQKKEERCDAEAERKRGLEQRIFSIYFPSNLFRKNDGEFVYVEFDF